MSLISNEENTYTKAILSLRFRKAEKVWCGGARETREPRVTIG